MKSFDPYTLVIILLAIPPAIHAIQQLVHSFIRWQEMRESNINLKIEIKNANDDEIKQQINALLEEIRQKRDTEKHS